jgi:hypothetical protein
MSECSSTPKYFDEASDVSLDTLEIRRKKIRLTMMYKIINNLIDIRAEEYLTKPTRQTRSSHSLKYQQFSASTDYYKHSFFPQTTSIWNTLPAPVAEAPCLVFFNGSYAAGVSIAICHVPSCSSLDHFDLDYGVFCVRAPY